MSDIQEARELARKMASSPFTLLESSDLSVVTAEKLETPVECVKEVIARENKLEPDDLPKVVLRRAWIVEFDVDDPPEGSTYVIADNVVCDSPIIKS